VAPHRAPVELEPPRRIGDVPAGLGVNDGAVAVEELLGGEGPLVDGFGLALLTSFEADNRQPQDDRSEA
jgi:hypothetical protein